MKITARFWIFGLLLADLVSFLGHYFPIVNPLAFVLAVGGFTAAMTWRYELAVMIALVEIFTGSFGRLFAVDVSGFPFSIRMAFFVALLGGAFLKRKEIALGTLKAKQYWPYMLLGAAALFAAAQGLMRGYSVATVFSDGNAFLFLLFLVPILVAFEKCDWTENLKKIIIISAVYVTFRTLALLYFFTHDFGYFLVDLNTWVRDSRLGEITWTTTGAYRVFQQSQIYVLVAWWIVFIEQLKRSGKEWFSRMLLLIYLSSCLLISFSRSFWLGWAVGAMVFLSLLLWQRKWKNTVRAAFMMFLSWFAAVVLILTILQIPYPSSTASSIDIGSRFNLTNEAAASSRWKLLPPLWSAVKEHAIFGAGFGSSVTAYSDDPRIRTTNNPSGIYQPSAFEWGYLDLWLDLGIFGVLALLWWAFVIARGTSWMEIDGPSLSLILGLISLFAVNIASPYLNHPLGLTYLILLTVLLTKPAFYANIQTR